MDLALTLNHMGYNNYRGSCTENDEAAFDALVFAVPAAKPTWAAVQASAGVAKTRIIDTYKSNAVKQVGDFAQEISERVIGTVPQTERDSWPNKEQAARAQQAGAASASETALLQAEADITGETLNELAVRIITNADTYRLIVGKIAGVRRMVTAAIMDDLVTTPQAVDTIMAGAQAQAETELAAILAA